jgi:hypothetical protein
VLSRIFSTLGTKILLWAFVWAFIGYPLFAGGSAQKSPQRQPPEYAAAASGSPLEIPVGLNAEPGLNISGGGKVEAEQMPENLANPQGALPERQEPDRGEQVMKALARAYPDRLGPAEYRDGDWAVPVRGVWYYYAEGRLLPGELRPRAAEYAPQPFYR